MLAPGSQMQVRGVPDASQTETVAEYSFLLDRCTDAATLAVAVAEGQRLAVPAVRVLIARSWVTSADYTEALSAHVAATSDLTRAEGRAIRPIDATLARPADILLQVEQAVGEGAKPLLLDRAALEISEPRGSRRRRVHRAAHHLRRSRPELAAGHRVWAWQLVAVVSAPGLFAGGLMVLPEATLVATTAVAAVPFLFVVGLRAIALLVLLAGVRAKPSLALREKDFNDLLLPTYGVLVPLYQEAHVLPGLVDAIAALDYPGEKLDVLLVLEDGDSDTRAAAAALDLPGYMRVVVVPNSSPRTKPKALNYALDLIDSELVVVYDAEDQPDRGQLRAAAAAFATGHPRLACVQAQLTIYNARASWLSRQFTLEYAALFAGLLPALSRLGLPIPLGGTSNHFRREILVAAGGWDAHNVTEDADLGMRLARAGYMVEVLAAETAEEAPSRFGAWVRQRTRWQKGFMQTWAVHMRRPLVALRELGLAGFIGLNAIIGGHVVSALLHPICLAVLGYAAWDGVLFRPPETALGGALIAVALFNLSVGYLSALALAGVAVVRRGKGWLVWHLAITPLYWLLVSAAAWRALWQVVRDPYGWEKTPHAPRARQRGKRQ